MGAEIAYIGPWQMVLALLFILAAGVVSIRHALGLGRDLLVGSVRLFVQLFLMGYVLRFVFDLNAAWTVLLVFAFMVFFAARIIRNRVKEKRISFFWPVFASMILSYTTVTIVVVSVVVRADPWWTPRYFIPIGGMVIGNSMNAIAIALERLVSELKKRRAEVEMMLSLGANYKEASRDMVKEAMRAGMIPSINSLMAVGIVFLPGMMTGQILAGADPLLAIRYQIVVMAMLVGSAALGSLIVVLLVRGLCFGPAQQLLIRPERK